jgi:glycosyltransferase involved in cell wall biosynthesis
MAEIKCLFLATIDMTLDCFCIPWTLRLQQEGLDMTLAATEGDFAQNIRAAGLKFVNMPISRRIAPFDDLVSLIKLYRFIKQEGFQIVHTHTSKAGFLGRLAAKLARVPLIIHTIHDLPHNSARSPLLKALYIWMERWAARWAHHLTTVSYSNLKEILRTRIAPEAKITVIRGAINLNSYPALSNPKLKRQELGIPEVAIVIGNVGRLEAAKGQVFLLKAAALILARHPDTYFVIVGKGRLKASLENLAQELKISHRVMFTGFRDDMPEIMQSFDIFAFPSLWEGLGMVLLEAMAYRLPVVASKIGGIQDVVITGETGILTKTSDHQALAAALMELLENPEQRRAYGEAGYKRVSTEFREDNFLDKHAALYRQLIKNFKLSGQPSK